MYPSESTCNITGLLNYNLLLRLSYRLGNVSVSKSFHKFILKQKQSSKYDAFEITHNRSVCVMLRSNSYGLHCGSLVLITWLLSAIGSTMLRQTIPKDQLTHLGRQRLFVNYNIVYFKNNKRTFSGNNYGQVKYLHVSYRYELMRISSIAQFLQV